MSHPCAFINHISQHLAGEGVAAELDTEELDTELEDGGLKFIGGIYTLVEYNSDSSATIGSGVALGDTNS